MESMPDIKYLFEPRGVATIGASANDRKIGYRMIKDRVDIAGLLE